VDGIIDPARTRETVAACIAACAHQGEIPRVRWGVLQT
jgi:acetyl-CoA carboxylase carboxyltransferase component